MMFNNKEQVFMKVASGKNGDPCNVIMYLNT